MNQPTKSEPFRYALNASTLRGHNLPFTDVIAIAAEAGYHGLEPWIDEIEKHVVGGGSLPELRQNLQDNGLTIEGAIGFAEWIVDDPQRRKTGLEQAKRDMDLIAQIGGTRIAAPPMGLTDAEDRDLLKIAERYRDLYEIGAKVGVTPLLEVWGFSKTLKRLGDAAAVVIESGVPNPAILADSYHLYKGGSPVSGLRVLRGEILPVFHINDYPQTAPETITDADRVYPGDGIAPLTTLFRTLQDVGFTGTLSLELFNAEYYRQDAATVAKTGLAKMRHAVQSAHLDAILV